MDLKLFDSLHVCLPEKYRAMTEQEKYMYFGNNSLEYCFLYPERKSVIRFFTADPSLERANITEQVQALYNLYARMTPGFVLGEALQRKKDNHDYGLLTFKSNAPERDLYNALVVTSLGEKSILILFSCDWQDIMQLTLPFSKMIDNLEYLPEVKENDRSSNT